MTPFIFWLIVVAAMLATSVLGLLLERHTPDAGASLLPLAEDADTYTLPFNVVDGAERTREAGR